MLRFRKALGIIFILLLTSSEMIKTESSTLQENTAEFLIKPRQIEINKIALLLGALEQSENALLSALASFALTVLKVNEFRPMTECNKQEFKDHYMKIINLKTAVFRDLPKDTIDVLTLWASQFNAIDDLKQTENLREFCENLKLALKEYFIGVKKLETIEDDEEYKDVQAFDCEQLPDLPFIIENTKPKLTTKIQAAFESTVNMIDCANNHDLYSKIILLSGILVNLLMIPGHSVEKGTYSQLMKLWNVLKTSYFASIMYVSRLDNVKLSEYAGKILARLYYFWKSPVI